jgi:hypothetical protein
VTVVITSIIFLNFIVAEASNSYNIINKNLELYVRLSMADMISEVEGLMPQKLILKKIRWYPKYIVSRKVEK